MVMQAGSIAIIFVLSTLVEGLVEYFGAPLPSKYKPFAAAALGILVCVIYNADLLALLGLPAAFPYAGSVLTGFVIARGANYINDVISRVGVLPSPATTVNAAEARPASPVAPSSISRLP